MLVCIDKARSDATSSYVPWGRKVRVLTRLGLTEFISPWRRGRLISIQVKLWFNLGTSQASAIQGPWKISR